MPSPGKFANGRTVYLSRQFKIANVIEKLLLCDFGSAIRGDDSRNHFAQPDIFRLPEVILVVEWNYHIDHWNLGVLV
ncbi:CMGC/SRPK protein kinase variant 3 [Penicillium antarcticum]|uniref:CMGC/SRPK protein kinase variant 3 n=1 Tax=Penicillium antarcticum TaxID=416450 RepID=UPI0023920414|nr:CMGC/SRPK protein kinase variant 3 [Penicillium antarcticum]KAJ5297956.1 CMGC/SRPK protein kinase variant 3 [Penicillium antarcticum]